VALGVPGPVAGDGVEVDVGVALGVPGAGSARKSQSALASLRKLARVHPGVEIIVRDRAGA
jgi:hypothetical protein